MKLLKLIGITALVLLLTNCKEEEVIDTHTPILFSSKVVTVEKVEKPQTRAAGTFPVDEKFQITVRDDAEGTKFNDITLEAQAGTNDGTGVYPLTITQNGPLYWDDVKGVNAKLIFFGIQKNYGVTDKTITNNKIDWTVSNDQKTGGVDVNDLTTAKIENFTFDKNNKEKKAALQFQHRLTKVTIVLKEVEGESGGYTLDELGDATITYKLPVGGSKYDLVKQKLFYAPSYDETSEVPTAASVTPAHIEYKEESVVKAHQFIAIAYPCYINRDAELATIAIKGNEYKVYIPVKEGDLNGNALEEGVHNVYNVIIRKTGISVTASVTDWTNGGGDINAHIVTPGEITINNSATDNTKLGDKAKMTMRITGTSSGPHTGNFTYDKDRTAKWQPVSGTEVYWDDVKRPVTKVEALLINSNDATPSGEHYFVGATDNNVDHDLDKGSVINLAGNVNAPFFKRPLCKIDIVVKTTQVESERVNIKTTGDKTDKAGIVEIRMLGCGTFKVADGGVTLERNGTGDLAFGSGQYNDNTYTDEKLRDTYTSPSIYILPYDAARTNLAEIVIREKTGDTYTNTYPVNLKEADKTKLEAGKHYTYTVTIKKTGISVTGALKDWETKETGIETGL